MQRRRDDLPPLTDERTAPHRAVRHLDGRPARRGGDSQRLEGHVDAGRTGDVGGHDTQTPVRTHRPTTGPLSELAQAWYWMLTWLERHHARVRLLALLFLVLVVVAALVLHSLGFTSVQISPQRQGGPTASVSTTHVMGGSASPGAGAPTATPAQTGLQGTLFFSNGTTTDYHGQMQVYAWLNGELLYCANVPNSTFELDIPSGISGQANLEEEPCVIPVTNLSTLPPDTFRAGCQIHVTNPTQFDPISTPIPITLNPILVAPPVAPCAG